MGMAPATARLRRNSPARRGLRKACSLATGRRRNRHPATTRRLPNDHLSLPPAPRPFQTPIMIVTHTLNAQGHRRVYLGGKASVECWIEPAADGIAWSFHMETAPTTYPLPDETMRAWAKHVLLELAAEVGAEPDNLKIVPFERIAALHTTNPADQGRAPAPRRQAYAHVFMTATPDIAQPSADFSTLNGKFRSWR